MGQGNLTRAQGDLWNNGVIQWSVYADWKYSSDGTKCTYSTDGIFIKSYYMTLQNTPMNWSITLCGQTWSGTNSAPGITRGSTVRIAGPFSVTVYRQTYEQGMWIDIWAYVPSYSAYAAGATAKQTDTLAPLASHTITFLSLIHI